MKYVIYDLLTKGYIADRKLTENEKTGDIKEAFIFLDYFQALDYINSFDKENFFQVIPIFKTYDKQ